MVLSVQLTSDEHRTCAKNEGLTPEHQRYVWLRDGKSSNGGYRGTAPFVMSPHKSRLYAIKQLRAEQLDLDVDIDIIETKADELNLHNEIVERGIMVSPIDRCSDEYADALFLLAKEELQWDDARFKRVIDYYDQSQQRENSNEEADDQTNS